MHVFAIVESKRLLIDVTKKMKRLHANIGSIDATLEQTPKVLNAVSMNTTVYILHGVINHPVRVYSIKPGVRCERVSVKNGSGLNVLHNLSLKSLFLAIRNHPGPNCTAALKDTKHHCFILSTGSGDSALLDIGVHIASLATDECLIRLYLARHLFLERAALHRKA